MSNYLSAKHIGLVLGPVVFLLLHFDILSLVDNSGDTALGFEVDTLLGITLWMVIWWMTEATHIAVTALLPLTLFPLLGITPIKEVTPHYAHPMIYLFFGGFVIALALERVNLHRRIALNILKLTGTRADGIILGFMMATTLLSMWISNTASTVVMLPIATSVIQLLINDEDGYSKNDRRFALSILLGIAFAANIGGTATPIGTPPSVFVIGLLEEQYNIQISFAKWMSFGVPFCLVLMGLTYLILVKIIYPNGLGRLHDSEQLIQIELDKLGKMNRSEILTAVIFFLAGLSWILRSSLNNWFDWSLSDTSIAMIAAMLIFVVPFDFKKRKFPLRWLDTSRLPWGILVLFGGGIALASALDNAGIVDMVGSFIASKSTWSLLLMTVVLIALVLFMTELIGNLPLVTVLSPLIAGLAVQINIPLLQILIPTTLAASCAFMLPMATPPNAIVFASGHIQVMDMAKAGIILNIVSVILLTILAYFVMPMVF